MEESIGPVEYLAVVFEGNEFRGEIIPELMELVDTGLIRIIDLAVVMKDDAGDVVVLEGGELKADVASALAKLECEYTGMLSEEDLLLLAAELPNQSTAAAMLFENVWAARFAQSVRNANGQLVMNVRIPHDVVVAARRTLIEASEA